MNPIELIERDLNATESDDSITVREQAELCPFENHRLFLVMGPSKRFDFPTLPHGSLGYYVANDISATRLTRDKMEIESVLAAEWPNLPNSCPIQLASLILRFYDGGIRSSHQVLADRNALDAYANSKSPSRNYQFNDAEYAKALPNIVPTTLSLDADTITLRVLTLCGWMHDKRNLGIERIKIQEDGHSSFDKREVLSRKIFSRVPAIRY